MEVLHCRTPSFLSPSWRLFVLSFLLALLSSPRCCPSFSLALSAWDVEERGKPPHEHARTLHHTHNENTMGDLKTWWDFRALRKVWMTVGGEAAQPVLDWHAVAVSGYSVGGNKEQRHGNHIKSTLKLIYLQKQWKLCWYSPFCCRCMFLQPHVNFRLNFILEK